MNEFWGRNSIGVKKNIFGVKKNYFWGKKRLNLGQLFIWGTIIKFGVKKN